MKKLARLLLLLSALFFLSSQSAIAQSYTMYGERMEQSYPTMAGEKLMNGIVNAATGFVELPKTIILTSQRDGVPYGLTVGLLTGLIHTVGRTVLGALDAATFFIPTRPTVYPPYIWQDFDRETTYG
ncbi:exosortase system-associated protein, TIGR04073 family [Nitrosomonas sp. Nm132]|jgi:putative exosortase-associated protein (TIGR04073 family)|uniref:exosortase system-associated protein, TIGR04073 family n=1 Tax=Nitrosomonas sp. Nm132 TaxID=1881053 RepID=UPI000882E758|nr:exosortase system-associated protein, TIGR04073 family [Nitrosomonas sp. Nm132]SDH72266.1 putative exosortase-associated protein, TIGR04073 family [Nitrosomonas sp. Nm132]